MLKVDVSLDDNEVLKLQEQIDYLFGGNTENLLPATKEAFDLSAQLIQRAWQGWAMGESIVGLPDKKQPNSRLASSVKINNASSFDVTVEAEKEIENVSPEYSIKKTHKRKSRFSKKKVPYAVLPFSKNDGEWYGFRNTIPKIASDIMKGFNRSRKSEYTWSERIKDEGNINSFVKISSNFGKGSEYFTFRIISAKSEIDKWLPSSLDVAPILEKEAQPTVENMIEQGLKKDLE